MTYLRLYFLASDLPELVEVRFLHPLLGAEQHAVRGRSVGVFRCGTFPWSNGVKALTALLVHAVAAYRADETSNPPIARLSGETGSLAATLDSSISKSTAWLTDMFGVDSAGFPLIRRIINRANSERKRPGPVVLSLNEHFLPLEKISIFRNNTEVLSADELLEIAARLSTNGGVTLEKSSNARPQATQALTTVPPHKHRDSLSSEISLDAAPPAQELPPVFRGILGQFTTSQDPFIQIPQVFSDTAIRDRVKDLFRREIITKLATTNIFSPTYLLDKMREIYADSSFCSLAGSNKTITSEIDLQLAASGRLGSGVDRAEIERTLKKDRPLRFAFPPPMVSTLAILTILKYVRGYNIEFDFSYAHSGEIVDRICSNSFVNPPDFCMLSIASASSLLGAKTELHYRPIMLMPDISHRVVQAGNQPSAAQDTSGSTYTFILDKPSTTSFIFQKLVASNLLQSSKTESLHIEPDEAPELLASGDPSLRSIMWFPCTEFNRLFNGCSFDPITAKINPNKEIILFGHESAWREPNLIRNLDIAIRDIWLDLSEGGALFDLAIEMIFENRNYLNLLGRYCGLNTISRIRRNSSDSEYRQVVSL